MEAREGQTMPSPFPGMNPYLEQADVWTDFHHNFIVRIANALSAQFDPRYIVKIDEQLYVHERLAEARWPVGLGDVDVERLPHVEVRDLASRRLITAIELLSPTNKYDGPHRDQYLSKRSQL